MAQMMKAAVLHAFGQDLQIEEAPVPEPGAGQVLVKVACCGVCHTDVHAVDGDWPGKPNLPLIPGHEITGTVAAVGPGVSEVSEGDTVGVPWLNSTCGTCDQCLTGWENLCKYQKSTGYAVNGGFADYVLADAGYVVPIPKEIPLDQAAPLLCAGLTSYKAIKETGARPGEWLAVSGVGGLGHLAIAYGKAMGLRVAAVDIGEDKLALATQAGADLVVNAESEDAARTIRKATGGAHGVVVTATAAAAYDSALGMLRTRGTLVMVAMPPADLTVPIIPMISRGITIRGSSVGSRKDLREALAFAADGKVTAHVETKPFEAVNDTIKGLREGTVTGRVVLSVN